MPRFFDRIPGFQSLARLPKQWIGINPFGADCRPTRVPLLFNSGRPSLPFPHPWNFQRPIDILPPTSGEPMRKVVLVDTIGIWTSLVCPRFSSHAIRVSSSQF